MNLADVDTQPAPRAIRLRGQLANTVSEELSGIGIRNRDAGLASSTSTVALWAAAFVALNAMSGQPNAGGVFVAEVAARSLRAARIEQTDASLPPGSQPAGATTGDGVPPEHLLSPVTSDAAKVLTAFAIFLSDPVVARLRELVSTPVDPEHEEDIQTASVWSVAQFLTRHGATIPTPILTATASGHIQVDWSAGAHKHVTLRFVSPSEVWGLAVGDGYRETIQAGLSSAKLDQFLVDALNG